MYFSFKPGLTTVGAVLLVASVLLISACDRMASTEEKVQAKKAPKPPLVEIVTAQQTSISTTDERTGSVQANRLVRIHNREEGRIDEMAFYESDAVNAGDLLAKIDASLLQAELAKAEALTRQAQIDLERMQDLEKRRAASKDELARARTELDVALAEQKILETRVDHTLITAPFNGIVSERLKEPGDMAAKNTHLLTLIDPQSLVVELAVSELTLPRIAIGDPAEVQIDALGPGTVAATVSRIFPALDPSTRQGIVELTLDTLPKGIRAGQFARVRLRTAASPRMMIPFNALQRDREGEFLYVLDAEDKPQITRVRSGARIADTIEILKGIDDGDRIVNRGFLRLRPGKPVRIAKDGGQGN